MKIYYKLTDKDGYTRNKTLWGENVTHEAIGENTELCINGFIHTYESPEMAIFINPIQDNYDPLTMLLWECKLTGKVKKYGTLKFGAKSCTTLRKIKKPIITNEQRIKIAIKISLQIYKERSYVLWANNWLSGEDRSARAARDAHEVADAAADAANNAASAAAYAAAFAADAAHNVLFDK